MSLTETLRPAPAKTSILTEDPRGRLDIALVRLGETACKNGFGRAGAVAWDHGLGDLVEALVVENGVPSRPVTAADIARTLGLLPKKSGRRRLKKAESDR